MNKQNKRHRRIRKVREGANFPGQHFMHSKRLTKTLVKMANLQPNDCVVEIGAGYGALTLPLAEAAGKVLAVENDPALVEKLHKKFDEKKNVTIIQKDFLQFTLPRTPFCVVANIPYSITTPILGKLLDPPSLSFQRAVLVMEKGAAKRFTAVPITDPRILKWRMWFDLRIGQTISPDQFSPPPQVDSAVLTIGRKKNPPVSPRHHLRLSALATHGLKQPQSPIFAALADVFTSPQMKQLVKNLGVDRFTPIGTLKEEQWAIVYQTMLRYIEPFRWPRLPKKR